MRYLILISFLLISAYCSAQNFEWGKTFGGNGDDVVRNMVVDAQGNTYTTGYFSDTAFFGEISVTSNIVSDIFLVKTNTDGDVIWVKSYGSEENDYANGIALDSDGNVYLTGAFQQTVDFNPGGEGGLLNSIGFHDMFILKLDSDGNFIWVKSIGSPDYEESVSISVDPAGNVYTAGYFFESMDFDPSDNEYIMNSSSGNGDAFVLKLNSDGDFQWAKQIGGEGSAYGKTVKVLPNGEIAVLGEFSGNCDLNTDSGSELSVTSPGKDIYLLRLDDSGNFLNVYHTSSSLESPSNAEATRFSSDSSGNIYIIGNLVGTVFFDSANQQEEFNISSDSFFYNGFVLKLDQNGEPQWVNKAGGSDMVLIYDVSVSDAGNAYLTGFFRVDAEFGEINITQQSQNFMDAFVAKINNDGQFVTAFPFGGSGGPDGHDIELDADGNVYLSSSFHDTVDINPLEGEQSVTVLGEDGYRDIYLIKLNFEDMGLIETNHAKYTICPNPTTGIFYLKSNNSLQNAEYQIFNLAGQQLRKDKLNVDNKIDINNFNSGIYILKIENGQTFRIIKN